MREILFRGKRLDNGEWVEGSFLRDGEPHRFADREDLPFSDCYIVPKTEYDNVRTYLTQGILLSVTAYHVIPSTVGQFTGLLDKNGKRIFEGDVCRFREWSRGEMCWVGNIHYENQQFVISGGPNKECETPFCLQLSRFVAENIEVIGTFHDNPELLEVNEDE